VNPRNAFWIGQKAYAGPTKSLDRSSPEAHLVSVMMSIGQAIRAAREAKGLTQPELGVLVGAARETISRWETGTYTIVPRTKIALESVLGPLGTVEGTPKRSKRSKS
jgi:DNA-binding XRE family transcriptional regulator